jgi:putative ABC transport system permease protein
VERATKRFRQGDSLVEAIRDVSLSIADGEFVAIMGASGSGKSTLLNVLAGLTRPEEGRVSIAGTDLASLLAALFIIFTTLSMGVDERFRQFAMLRAVALSKGQIGAMIAIEARLIVAESLLIGVVACALSLGFGAMAGYRGTGVTRYINIRGGQITPLVIPWAKLTVGFAMAMGLCLLAALWPAIQTGRTEPSRLLQAGRAAT